MLPREVKEALAERDGEAERLAAALAARDAAVEEARVALDALDQGGMKGRLCWRKDELRMMEFP